MFSLFCVTVSFPHLMCLAVQYFLSNMKREWQWLCWIKKALYISMNRMCLRCLPQDITNYYLILVHLMAWYRHATGLQEALLTPHIYCQMASLGHNKQRVLMHGHQGWNVRHGLCHIYMIYVYIWVVYSFCLFCCLFIIVTTQFVALYKPCKPKPKFR